MATLLAKPGRRLSQANRRLAFAHGARSAVDLSGLITVQGELFRSGLLARTEPATMIARDMARVMDQFARSAACGRKALESGINIDDLKPGCTASESLTAAFDADQIRRRPRGDAPKRTG